MKSSPVRIAASLLVIAIVAGVSVFVYRRQAIDPCVGLPERPIEPRLAGMRGYEPPVDATRTGTGTHGDSKLLDAFANATALSKRDPSVDNLRAAGRLHLLAGDDAGAARFLTSAIETKTGEVMILPAIRLCDDAALLTDLAACEIVRSAAEPEALLVAIEAAQRAWSIEPTEESGWNRALALQRLGVRRAATSAWDDFLGIERVSGWRGEASRRLRSLAQPAATPAFDEAESTFERQLRATPDEALRRIAQSIFDRFGDRLPIDTANAVLRPGVSLAGLKTYTDGDAAFERGDVARATELYASAERQLRDARIPYADVARLHRIRSECTANVVYCLQDSRALVRTSEAHRYVSLLTGSLDAEGQALWERGRIFEAVAAFDRSLATSDAVGAGSGWTHILLANALATAGESDTALEHQLIALRWAGGPIGDRPRQVMEESALLFLRYDALAAAGVLIDELSTPGAPDDARLVALALRGIREARLRHSNAAAAAFEGARKLLAVVPADNRERLNTFLDSVEAGARRYTASAPTPAFLTEAIRRYERTPQSVWLPQLLVERGMAYERQRDVVRAEADYERAMTLLERWRPRVDRLLLGADLRPEGESAFDDAVRLMLRETRVAHALSIADRAKALRISAVFAESSGLRDSYHAAEPPRFSNVAVLQRQIRDGDTLIVYHMLHDVLITWTVSRTAIVAYRQPVRAVAFVKAADALRACAEGSSCTQNANDAVASVLLRPWIGTTKPQSTLTFVPPPELGEIPFSLLTVDGQPLLRRNAVSIATSIRAFEDAVATDDGRRSEPSALFAAAGDPEPELRLPVLPLAREEVNMAASAYKSPRVLTHATRDAFLASAPAFSIIHFAGHALVDEHQPLQSALVFDRDCLYVHELSPRTFAHARLVVLSACSTGHEPRPTMSIATALLHQDVPSVVYTLWRVSDPAAAAFSRPFHQALRSGRSRASALRDAQLRMAAQGFPTAAWAGFQLAGAPGPLD